MTFNPSPKAPKVQYSQPCRKCQGTLYRVTTGNVVDYRHAGGEFLCQQPQSPQQPKPQTTSQHWGPAPLETLIFQMLDELKEPSQADFVLDA